MAQLFSSGMNTVARVIIIGGALSVFLGGAAAMHSYWSPLGTNVNVAKEQVVPFYPSPRYGDGHRLPVLPYHG